MPESLGDTADQEDVDERVGEHRSTETHDEPQPPAGKGEAGGVAELDDAGTLRSGQVPNLAVTDTFTVTNEADLTGLDAQVGDVGIVTSDSASFILTGEPDTIDNWTQFETPPAPVQDVEGKTGSVDLTAADVDAEPSGSVEDHRTGETHTTAQPPETHGEDAHDDTVPSQSDVDAKADDPHGNAAHSSTFAVDGDAQPPENHGNGAHTETYTTSSEAADAAPVQQVNEQTGDVTLSASPTGGEWATAQYERELSGGDSIKVPVATLADEAVTFKNTSGDTIEFDYEIKFDGSVKASRNGFQVFSGEDRVDIYDNDVISEVTISGTNAVVIFKVDLIVPAYSVE